MLGSYLAFAGAAALVILIPGPDTLVVLRGLLAEGRRTGARTALGVLCGLTTWVAAATVGLTTLLRASHDGYLALRLVGAAYLLWVGVQALRARALQLPDGATPPRSLLGRGFKAGLATDLLNPKVGIFCITFLPLFIPSGAPVVRTTLVLGAMFVIETALYLAVLVTSMARVVAALANERARQRLNRATGLVLVGFGVRMLAEG